MVRYPEDTTASIEDFRCSDWKKAIAEASSYGDGYYGLWQSFSTEAKSAIKNGKVSEGKILWLLADACSMALNPGSDNEPFKPFAILDGRRSLIPDDLQEPEVDLLFQISEEIDHAWVQARLADLTWLLKRPRSPRHAMLAIDAYRKIPLDKETWLDGGRECWDRAICLARLLKSATEEKIEDAILSAFNSAGTEDGFFTVGLAELLGSYGLGQNNRIEIAEKLEMLARLFEQNGDLHQAREFFNVSAKWYKQARNLSKFAEMTGCIAENWVKEAMRRIASDQPSYSTAAGFYEKAIQTYRRIPRRERANLGVDKRIAEVHQLMNIAGEKSLSELKLITSPSINITELIEHSRNMVREKTTLDALLAFTSIQPGAQVTRLREAAENSIRKFPLRALSSGTLISKEGRVVAKYPGIGFSDASGDEYQMSVWAQMVQDYVLGLSLIVQGQIWPALEVLLLEHRLRENDFVEIASQSPIVPSDRERLFGRGLFFGYERDFVGALHLLTPQIEHMVRWHLKASGVKTTTLDQRGIETENGLSTLMDLPETARVFGDDLAFEIKALFCDPFGPNFRNELAHGLLDEGKCYSTHSVYAWWLCLRIVFNTFWNLQRREDESADLSDHSDAS